MERKKLKQYSHSKFSSQQKALRAVLSGEHGSAVAEVSSERSEGGPSYTSPVCSILLSQFASNSMVSMNFQLFKNLSRTLVKTKFAIQRSLSTF